jgi:hypothetical protein
VRIGVERMRTRNRRFGMLIPMARPDPGHSLWTTGGIAFRESRDRFARSIGSWDKRLPTPFAVG